MTNILHTFLTRVSAANTGQTRRNNKKVCIACSSMTHCVSLARGDMLNKLLILNNLCESLQWLSEHTNTLGMS